jgi:hypothetical protein
MKFHPFILGTTSLLIKSHDTVALQAQPFTTRKTVPMTIHSGMRMQSSPHKTSSTLFAEKKKKDDENKNENVDKLLSAAVGALKGVGVSILGDEVVVEEVNIAEQLKQQVAKEISMNKGKRPSGDQPIDEMDVAEKLKKQVENEIAINELKKQMDELKKAAEESEEKKTLALKELESLKKQSMEVQGKDESFYKELQKEFR